MESSDARQSTASHSASGALLVLDAYFKGAQMASRVYERALLQVASDGSCVSSRRQRFALEVKKHADENLNRETFFYLAALTVCRVRDDPRAVQTYNAMAERERRQTRTLQDKLQRLKELRHLTEMADVPLFDYCWKIFSPGSGIAPRICSAKCRKGLHNRNEYLKRQELLT